MTGRHARAEMAAFLDQDFRQVWAVHRKSGEPHYLPDGQAETLRPVAKRDWRCPFPGCVGPYTTVGGTKRRHHFKHLGDVPHPSDGESAAHVAGKAMLRDWAQARLPAGGSVREEETVKDPATALHRIADVMVTGPPRPDGARKVAFEVEYKSWPVDQWRKKQADYDSQDIRCAWLLGHTKIRPFHPPTPGTSRAVHGPPPGGVVTSGGDYWDGLVRVPPLGTALAASGRHVLVINPATRQIGTLSGDAEATKRVTERADRAWLWLDSIDKCDLDPVHGILTPTMRRINDATAAREAEQARLRAEAAEAARRLAAQEAKEKAERDRIRARNEKIAADNQTAWDTSPLRTQAETLWPHDIPSVLDKIAGHFLDSFGIHALPVHWHSALYLTHIHNQPAGHRFTVADCYTTLDQHGINKNWDRGKAFKTLIGFLNALTETGVIALDKNDRGYIDHIRTLGPTIDQAEAAAAAQAQVRRHERPRTAATNRTTSPHGFRETAADRAEQRTRKQRQAQRDADADAARADQAARFKTLDDAKAAHQTAWETSPLHRIVTDTYGGTIPPAIAWPGGEHRDTIAATPAHWYAHIYMRLIHQQPRGVPITIPKAVQALEDSGLPLVGSHALICLAADSYLDNLRSRGILTRPDDPTTPGWIIKTSPGWTVQHPPAALPLGLN